MMKTLNLTLALLLAFAVSSFAGDWSSRPNYFHTQSSIEIQATGEAASWTEIDVSGFGGGALYQYEIICTDDDAVDLSLATLAPDGTNYSVLATITTTDANDDDNDAEIGLFTNFYIPVDGLYYKLENISSNTCSIRLTKWDK